MFRLELNPSVSCRTAAGAFVPLLDSIERSLNAKRLSRAQYDLGSKTQRATPPLSQTIGQYNQDIYPHFPLYLALLAERNSTSSAQRWWRHHGAPAARPFLRVYYT